MAWSWSHTNEAYANAYNNLHNQPREWLNVCIAEWNAEKQLHAGKLARYPKSLAWAESLPADDIAADFIWEKMEVQATCDNGGFNAWACPFGCHTVTFDCEEVES